MNVTRDARAYALAHDGEEVRKIKDKVARDTMLPGVPTTGLLLYGLCRRYFKGKCQMNNLQQRQYSDTPSLA